MRRLLVRFLILIFLIAPMLPAAVSRDLQVWFADYNEAYFWNSLPKDTEVDLVTDLGDSMGDSVCEDFHTRCRIRIEERSNPEMVEQKLTLLHEMCHVATWGQQENPHGSKWNACMHRVIDMGAMDDLY